MKTGTRILMKNIREKAKSDGTPQYALVMKDIIKKIHDGVYRPGAKIESIRELAEMYQVGRKVAHKAVDMLAANDYVNCEPKRGIFINPLLKTGLFYQIGYYLEDANPLAYGETMSAIFSTALKHGFRVRFGFSEEEKNRIDGFLGKHREIDGLLVGGHVDEKLLSGIRESNIPYVVMGNYKISAEHPQQTVDVEKIVYDTVVGELKKFKGRRIGALMGDDAFAADIESIRGIKRAIRDAAGKLEDDLVVSCKTGDGLTECIELLENHSPDVLYIMGGHIVGYRKYCRMNPKARRPYVICNTPWPGKYQDIIDTAVHCPLCTRETAEAATERLLGMICDTRR